MPTQSAPERVTNSVSETAFDATPTPVNADSAKRTEGFKAIADVQTILVVEDNSPLLEVTCKLLEVSGYSVIAAGSGEEAIRLATTHIGPIEVLLTDIRMPNMNGCELSLRLRKERPGIKVIFVSGSDSDTLDDDDRIEMPVGQAFLQKPFSRQSLAMKIREVCESHS